MALASPPGRRPSRPRHSRPRQALADQVARDRFQQGKRRWLRGSAHDGIRILAHHRGKVGLHGAIEILAAEFQRFAGVIAVAANLQQQVAGLAAPQPPAGRAKMAFQQVFDHFAAILAAERLGIELEQLAELLLARIADLDLVGNPPQEGLVDQVARFQVRGKDHQLVEGHLQLLARGRA